MPLSLLPESPVYLIGPMTGYQNDNREMFQRATALLRELGVRVISPDELDIKKPVKPQWECYLRRDIREGVLKARSLVALPGWRLSRGATLEACVGGTLGLPVYEFFSTRRNSLADIRPVQPSQLPSPAYQGFLPSAKGATG